jgi:hypothetical protein
MTEAGTSRFVEEEEEEEEDAQDDGHEGPGASRE